MIDGCHIDPVFTSQANGGHLDILILQFFLKQVAGFRTAFPVKMCGIADFDRVIVDIQIDQVRGFAADDDLVIAGMFQFRSEEPTK